MDESVGGFCSGYCAGDPQLLCGGSDVNMILLDHQSK